jgi:hypothetical protein
MTKPKTRKAAAKTATLEQRWRLREIRRLLKIAIHRPADDALDGIIAKLVDRRWTEFMEERAR